MDAPLYDVYLTGKLIGDTETTQAAQRLAALFKSTPETMAGMLTGKPQLLKRGVDKATALKYRDALLKAGIEVAFKAQAGAVQRTAAALDSTQSDAKNALTLAPAGSDLLRANEHRTSASADIDTSALQLAPPGPLIEATAPSEFRAPDVGHLSLAPAEGELLSAAERQQQPTAAPAIPALTLAPPGALLETLHQGPAPIDPDTSELSLAAPGADLLTPAERDKPVPAAPSTAHIKLA